MYQKCKNIIWLVLISAITVALFYRSLAFEFMQWNESQLILENQYVKELNFKNMAYLFTNISEQEYIPVTKVSYSIDYAIGDGNPYVFHLVNLILHLMAIVFAFYLVKLLIPKFEVAVIAALLFAIHPLHVESVVWISNRADLLAAIFLFAGLILYSKSYDSVNKNYKWWSVALFVLALLSSEMALIFIFLIFMVDYIKEKSLFSRISLISKWPYLLISLLFGIITILVNKNSNTIFLGEFDFIEKIALSCFSFTMYFAKLIFPFNLSNFYPYPILSEEGLPLYYWLSTIVLLAIIGLIIYFVKTEKKELAFALLFFVSAIIFFVWPDAKTGTIMSDRNSYVSGLGVFSMVGILYSYLGYKKILKISGGIILLIYVGYLGYLAFNHQKVYANSLMFSNTIVKNYPDHFLGYNYRGEAFTNVGSYKQALADFNKSVSLNQNCAETFLNRGITMHYSGRFDMALSDFNIAHSMDSMNYELYFNRGLVLNKMGNFDEAIADFEKFIELKGETAIILLNIANSYLYKEEYQQSLEFYDRAVLFNPTYAEAYAYRGNLKVNFMQLADGYKDFETAEKLDPENRDIIFLKANGYYENENYDKAVIEFSKLLMMDPENSLAAYYRGNCKFAKGNFNDAIIDYTLAIELNPNYFDAFVNRGSAYFQNEEYEIALRDYNTAIKLNAQSYDAYNNRGIAEYYLGRYKEAILDFSKALQINNNLPAAFYYRGLSYIKINRLKIGCRDLKVAKELQYPDKEKAYDKHCN